MLTILYENVRMNKDDRDARELVISQLIEEGYGSYAQCLTSFPFIVTDRIGPGQGGAVETACMTNDGIICINPGFFVARNVRDQDRMLRQLSFVVRHELLHYLLTHFVRMKNWLSKNHPDIKYPQTLANYAADWDLSREGYDEEDKKIAKAIQLNGEVIKGLVLELDRPDLMNLSFEELLEKLWDENKDAIEKARQEYEKHKNDKPTEVHVKKETHSKEYVDIYNKIMSKYDDPQKYNEADITEILDKLQADGEIDID